MPDEPEEKKYILSEEDIVASLKKQILGGKDLKDGEIPEHKEPKKREPQGPGEQMKINFK